MKAILKTDIKSSLGGSKARVYGRKNQPVTIISERGNVLIVELEGERFPVNRSKIQII